MSSQVIDFSLRNSNILGGRGQGHHLPDETVYNIRHKVDLFFVP